jgi:hypothetical protein
VSVQFIERVVEIEAVDESNRSYRRHQLISSKNEKASAPEC